MVESGDGRREFLGLLKEVRADGIVCAAAEGERFVAFNNIAQANYEHEFPEPQQRRRASGR